MVPESSLRGAEGTQRLWTPPRQNSGEKGRALQGEIREGEVPDGRLGRGAVLVVVVAIHAAFVVILMRAASVHRIQQGEPPPLILFTIPILVEPPKERARATAEGERKRPSRSNGKTALPAGENEPETTQAAPPASIDWAKEAERSASDAAIRLRDNVGKCNEHGDPSSKLPPCPPRPREFEWSREKQRVGVEHGFLYFRPTERCVVGFGIFGVVGGCSIGKEEANGHLFDGMKSPDRRTPN